MSTKSPRRSIVAVSSLLQIYLEIAGNAERQDDLQGRALSILQRAFNRHHGTINELAAMEDLRQQSAIQLRRQQHD